MTSIFHSWGFGPFGMANHFFPTIDITGVNLSHCEDVKMPKCEKARCNKSIPDAACIFWQALSTDHPSLST